MRTALSRHLVVAAVTAPFGAFPALAQDATNSVGGRVSAALSDMVAPVIFVIALVSFCGGLFLLAKGVIKLKEIAAGNGRGEATSAFLCILGATCLICLPEVSGVGVTTVFGDDGFFGNSELMQVQGALDSASGSPARSAIETIIGRGTVTPPTNCLAQSDGGVPAACMARNIALNFAPVGVMAVFLFGFVFGLVVFASCLVELTKGEGHQKPPSFWGKLFGSVLLMNAIFFFITSSNTLLGTGQATITANGVDTSSSLLSYTGTGTGILTQYAAVVGYCFVILTFFGAFAFLKGIFLIKDASEGRGQATYSHGMVFLFAGILLANAKVTTCLVLTTVTGGGNTAGFC